MVRWGLFFARNFFPFREGLHSRLREKVRGKRKQGLLQVERNPDIFRKKRPSVRREEKGERPCPKGACQSEGDCDGRLVRDTEGALRSPKGQGQDEADGNPLHLLRHPHGKCGPVGGQDRTKGAFGGCLILKLAVNAELLWENCILAMKNRQKNRPKRPETDIKLKF